METQSFVQFEITLEILRVLRKQLTRFTVDTLVTLIRLWKGYGLLRSMEVAGVTYLIHILLNVTVRKVSDSMMYMGDFDGMTFHQQSREDA